METASTQAVEKIAADGRINVVSPLDGRIVDRIPTTRVLDLPGLISRARQAQASWAGLPLKTRAKQLQDLAPALAEAAPELVEILREEIGRHPAESWFAEIVPNTDLIKWWTKTGIKHLKQQKVPLNPINFPGKSACVGMIPRGLLGLITPWNYPVSIPLRAIVPGLLAGNAILWKPSEYAAKTSQKLAEIVHSVLPADLLVVAQGDGRIGSAVVDQVDGIGFTGSLAVGQKIAAGAAQRLIPASLELGGKDFAVVLPDANLKRAAAGIAWGALTNAGQNCASIEVVAVHNSVAPRFMELLREEVRKMSPYVGPLVNQSQHDKVAAQLDDALRTGALVVEGGMGSDGLRIEPTLIERASWDSKIIREETFGPVLPLQTFQDLDEIEQYMDTCDYGLTLSLWTKDTKKGLAWLRGKPAGVVTVNNHGFTAGIAAMPWTGVKGSGLGVTNGPHALEWMVRPQGMLIDRSGQREPWWHPFNDSAVQLAQAIADLNTGRRFFSAIKDLLTGFITRWK